MATALPSNSTLRRLELHWLGGDASAHLSLVLLALGENRGLKDVTLHVFGSMEESVCTAIRYGLGMNTTIESLELNRVELNDNKSDLWCSALSFLRTNKALKSLVVNLKMDATESRIAAFRTDVVAMLQENVSLQSLSIRSQNTVKADERVALLTALQQNSALKSLILQHYDRFSYLTDDEDKEMAVLLKKNYALERLPDINQGGDVGAIFRLNGVDVNIWLKTDPPF
jgi:hypothetical protein